MKRYGELVQRLARVEELERRLVDFYRHAGDSIKDDVLSRALHGLSGRHHTHLERIDHARERLKHSKGEGIFAASMESIGGAFASLIAAIPAMMVERETMASLDTLKRYEASLLEEYQQMLELAREDEDVRPVIESIIEDSHHNIERLDALDPLK